MQLTLFDTPTQPIGRHALDAYYSPYWFTTHAMQHLPISGTVLECCAGDLAIANVLNLYPQIDQVFTNDINAELTTDFCLDATKKASWQQFPMVDFVVTNPPFSNAGAIVKLAHQYARRGVLMFLRQTFLEPTEGRGDWLSDNPPTVEITMPRFKFRQDEDGTWQTDSATICAFFWSKEGLPCQRIISPRKWIEGFYSKPPDAPAWDEVVKQVRMGQ